MRPVTLLLLLVCALPAGADPPDSPARALLMLADSPPQMRGRLLVYADSTAAAGNRLAASEALNYAGTSFQREGRVDSAIVCHRRAVELVSSEERLFALVDQLLLRNRPGDAAEVLERLAAAAAKSEFAPSATMVARMAWARFQQGMPDSAAALFASATALSASVGVDLAPDATWRYRMARVAQELRQYRRAAELLLPVAIRAHGTDQDVISLLEQAGGALGAIPRLQAIVVRQSADRDRDDLALATALGGRLLGITASDSFPLAGLLVPAARASGRRSTPPPVLAIVLMPPGDTLASGDSLALALRRHGMSTLLLQLRGHGASVGPTCPVPDAWFDREALLQARVARDVRDVMRAVARTTTVDTTRYLVVGAGSTVTMAVEAALLDPRVKALLLVSPAPALVERGLMRARLARLRLPVFFQIGPERSTATYRITDVFYRAGNAPASRVVETSRGGACLAQFQNDPTLAVRFLAWLDATLRTPAAPHTTRPAPRR